MDHKMIIWASLGMIVVGLGMIYALMGKKKKAKSPIEWFGFGLSALLVVFAGVMLILGFTIGDTVHGPFGDQRSAVGRPAPNFTFKLLKTDAVKSLADYRGEVVLLNFWGTWCAPCIDEMPDLNQIQEEHGAQGLRVITISDENPEELMAFDEYIPLNTETGYIEDGTALPMPFVKMLEGRPESYLIDRDGTIKEFILGARNYTFFKALIAPYMDS